MGLRDFCAARCLSVLPAGGKVLDFGCGAGEIVRMLLNGGADAYGCDVFFDGGDYSNSVPADLLGTRILRTDPGVIPFPDATFDVVVSNQVFEHIPDEAFVPSLREIRRVLKPGGCALSFFPSREVWHEGHCGVPLLHKFQKRDFGVRLAYATAFRAMGFGYFKRDDTWLGWAKRFCQWLDNWTHYRTRRELEAAFSSEIGPVASFEEDCFDWKLHRSLPLPVALKRTIVRRGAGLAFACTKA